MGFDDNEPSESSSTEGGSEHQQQHNSADAVAAALRDRVRAQAAALLDKVDVSRSNTNSQLSSRHASSTNSLDKESKEGDDYVKNNLLNTGSGISSTVADITGGVGGGLLASGAASPRLLAAASSGAASPRLSSSAAAVVASPPSSGNYTSSGELTKRLQKLALERQKETSHDRLKVIQADTSSHLSSVKTFQELNLPKHLLDAIFAMGFDRPSAIQEEALPRILANPARNLIGQAQSGSGKTAAFTLGMLYRIKVDCPATTQALCVTPTRELAIQIVDKAVKPMAANMQGLKIELAISGNHISKKDAGGGLDAHLVVGTPGKVVDWLKRRIINSKTIKVFVLDEADNMVDEGGFRANSQLIKKTLPPKCQCLLFSATFTPEVVRFASKMVDNPDKILVEDGPEFLVRLVAFCVVFFRLLVESTKIHHHCHY
jgi:DEAD/DEAH box helicase